jgi:hypothetical protein
MQDLLESLLDLAQQEHQLRTVCIRGKAACVSFMTVITYLLIKALLDMLCTPIVVVRAD